MCVPAPPVSFLPVYHEKSGPFRENFSNRVFREIASAIVVHNPSFVWRTLYWSCLALPGTATSHMLAPTASRVVVFGAVLAALPPLSHCFHATGSSGGLRAASPRMSVDTFTRARAPVPTAAAAAAAAVRARSIRPDGLREAGLRYAEAGLASTTGPVFNADDVLAEGEVLRPSQAILGLYAAFNARDEACVASFLTDDCVYEDLLLGPATVCRGKQAFMNALRFHPAFVSSRVFSRLPFADLLPALTLEVDSIAEGQDTVGVEWHVQCGDRAFPLGRGLSQARVCTETGKIQRVVDIAEAPWRVIGLLALPLINLVQLASRTVSRGGSGSSGAIGSALGSAIGSSSGTSRVSSGSVDLSGTVASGSDEGRGAASGPAAAEREYELLLGACLADGVRTPS